MLLSVFKIYYIVAVRRCSGFNIRCGDILVYELRSGKRKIKRKIVKSRKFEDGYHSECQFRLSIYECQYQLSNKKTHFSRRCQFRVSTCECQFANIKYQDALDVNFRMSVMKNHWYSECQFPMSICECEFPMSVC